MNLGTHGTAVQRYVPVRTGLYQNRELLMYTFVHFTTWAHRVRQCYAAVARQVYFINQEDGDGNRKRKNLM